ncbi:MAG TPA: LPXTG cell wall anchor domain-containing protein [Acidimicrobiales bacterium]|nr:LPXTG cell wall anchor domain-containing protein [Acidimicrobiales bacterium]
MRAGLERKIIRRALGALLLTGVLLVAGATAASADGYGPTYPVPSVPPQAPPGTPEEAPPTLARTGSDSDVLVGAGVGAVVVGGGLVLLARQRRQRLAVVPT